MANRDEMAFKWSPKFAHHGVDVSAARAVMEQIRGKDTGQINPQDLVRESSPEDSPTHGLFEWSNLAAARAHRLHQAEGAIRAVSVRVNGRLMPVYKKVCVVIDQGDRAVRAKRYASVSVKPMASTSEPTSWQGDPARDRRRALDTLRGFVTRYRDLPNVATLVTAVEQLIEKSATDTDAAAA